MSSKRLIDLGGMKAEVLEDRHNKVIGRREVTLSVSRPLASTPSRLELRQRLAQRYGVDVARLYVESVLTEYGANVSRVVVHIYDSPERAKLFEPEYVIKKNGGENPEGA